MNIKRFSTFFCSGFGIGFFPYFPGTLASFVILPIMWYFKVQISLIFIIISIFIYYLVSYVLLKIILIDKNNMDPKYVVCDEYIGQSIALLFCDEKILDYIIAFLLFRILDILKPFPISYFDNSKTISGVLIDDVIAGIFVALIFLLYYAK